MQEVKEHIAIIKLVPQIRFKEFDGNWETKPCFDLFRNSRTKGHIGLPIYSVTLDRGMIPRNTLDRKTDNAANPNDNIFVARNNISYNMMRMWQGAFGKAPEDCMVSAAYVVLEPKKDVFTDFFVEYFDKKRSTYLFTAYSYGLTSDRLRLYFKDFARIKFNVPTLPEQQKIASFLSAVDEKIQQLTKKKSLLEQFKKGVMQQLFSGQLRFKDENGNEYPDWKKNRLGALCSTTTGKLDANAMSEYGEYRFYTCAREYYRIDKYAFDTEALLVSGNGANVGYIHYYKGKFNAYQRTYVLDGFKQNIFYIKKYLEKNLYERIHVEKKDGNTPYITLSTLTEMKIDIPSQPEQQKIATYLSSIDTKIESVNSQFNETQTFKKGLLQQMFV